MSLSKRQKKDYLYFYSGSEKPWCQLSNFSKCEIVLEIESPEFPIFDQLNPNLKKWLPAKFNSAEHLWKSLQSKDEATFRQFQMDGLFGNLTQQSMEIIYGANGKQKYHYWSLNDNVGIVAKLISNPTRYKKLGLNLEIHLERLSPEVERQVWEALLSLKYRQNPNHLAVLKSTENFRLIEFDRNANQKTHWGGKIVDGDLVGENVMGQYLEAVRAKF